MGARGLIVTTAGRRFWIPLEHVLFVAKAGDGDRFVDLPKASAPLVSLAQRRKLRSSGPEPFAVVVRGRRLAYAVAVEELVGVAERDDASETLNPEDLLSEEEERKLGG